MVKVFFTTDDESYPVQVFYAKDGEGFKEIIRSFKPVIPEVYGNDTAIESTQLCEVRVEVG